MKTEIKYIELISGFTHDGPAWIGLVSFFDVPKEDTTKGKNVT